LYLQKKKKRPKEIKGGRKKSLVPRGSPGADDGPTETSEEFLSLTMPVSKGPTLKTLGPRERGEMGKGGKKVRSHCLAQITVARTYSTLIRGVKGRASATLALVESCIFKGKLKRGLGGKSAVKQLGQGCPLGTTTQKSPPKGSSYNRFQKNRIGVTRSGRQRSEKMKREEKSKKNISSVNERASQWQRSAKPRRLRVLGGEKSAGHTKP